MSVSQEYQLKVKRNPFQLNKAQKVILLQKNTKDKSFSKKQRVLIASSPQLKTFYNLYSQRQTHSKNHKQILTTSSAFFKNKNGERETLQKGEKSTTGYYINSKKKMSLHDLKIITKKSINKKNALKQPKRNATSTIKKKVFSFNQRHPQTQNLQKTFSDKKILVPNTLRLKQPPQQSELRNKLIQNVSEVGSKQQRKKSRKYDLLNKVICQNQRTIYRRETQQNYEETRKLLNFTFGRPIQETSY